MSTLGKSIVLFLFNCLDAQLTIFWLRHGAATEGNALMAALLDAGSGEFLAAKFGVAALASTILYWWSDRPLARHGLKLTLALYILVMYLHTVTGFSMLFSPF